MLKHLEQWSALSTTTVVASKKIATRGTRKEAFESIEIADLESKKKVAKAERHRAIKEGREFKEACETHCNH